MKQLTKNQSGFTIIEGLLIVLVLAIIGFGGYYVYSTQHKTKNSSSTSSNNSTSVNVKNPSSTSSSSNPSATKYLDITQAKIKLPLANPIIYDMTYVYILEPGGYSSIKLYSRSLAQFEVQQAPECSSAVNVNQGEFLGVINQIAPGVSTGSYPKVIINNVTYTFATPQSGYGCASETTSQQNSISQELTKYETVVTAAFQGMVAD